MEVTTKLRFTFPCLGSVRQRRGRGTWFRFDRTGDDRVLFLPSQWSTLLRYAANTTSSCQGLVERVAWEPAIAGTPATNAYRRRTAAGYQAFVFHEMFEAGTEIAVDAALPQEMTLDEFARLLTFIGTHRGFSPYHDKREKYGTFTVESVLHRVRLQPQEIES